MEIFDSLDQKIQLLEEAYNLAIMQSHSLPDAAYHLFLLEAEIRDTIYRKERFSTLPERTECHLGNHPVKGPGEFVRIGNKGSFIVCNSCIGLIQQMVGTTEFEKNHALKNNSVNADIRTVLQPLIEHNLIIKSGKVWIIHDSVYFLYYKKQNKTLALNSWIDELYDRLEKLQQQQDAFKKIKDSLSGTYSQVFSLNAQIDDLKNKVSKIEDDSITYRCSECECWIKKKSPTFFGVYTICDDCKKVLSGIMSFRKAEEKFKLAAGTLKRDNARGKLDRYKERGLIKQSGSTWIIHEIVVMAVYRELPEHTVTPSYTAQNIPSSLLERSRSVYNKLKNSDDSKSEI